MDKNYDKEERINGTPCGGNEVPRGFDDLPLLRYLKEPAYNLGELYVRYPDGGEDGWFCLLPRKGQIAFWDPVAKKWSSIGTDSSGEGSGDYRLLANKPVLNTKNSESLEGKTELIENVVQLHRVSKTGKYDDLLYRPVLDSSSFISLEPSDSELIDQVIRLHRIAKTGNYNDLVGTPDVDQLIQDLEAHLRTRAGEFLGHARTGEDLVFTDEGMGRIKDNVLLRGLPTIEGELPVSDNSSRIASTAFVQNLVAGIEVLEGVDSVHTDSGTTLLLHNSLEYEELVRLSGGKLSVYATDGKELLKDDGNRLGLGDLSRSVDIAGRELLMNVPGSWGVSTCTASLYCDAFRICSNGISVECNNIGIQANDTLGVQTNDLRVQARNLTEESDSADVQSNNYLVSSVSFRQESTEFDQESVRMNVHTETFYLNTNTFRISNWPVDNSSRTTIDCWEPVYVEGNRIQVNVSTLRINSKEDYFVHPVIEILNGVGTVNGVTLRNEGSGKLFLNDNGVYDRIKLIAYSELKIKNFTDFDPDICNLSQGDVVAFSSVSNAPGKPAWNSTECSGIIICTYTKMSDKYYKYLAFPAQQHTSSLFAYGYQQKIGGVLQPLVWKYVKGEDTP